MVGGRTSHNARDQPRHLPRTASLGTSEGLTGAYTSCRGWGGHKVCPEEFDREACLEEQARSTLILSVKEHHHATFYDHSTARGACEALAGSFRSRSKARTMNQRLDLNGLRMERGESVTLYFSRGKSFVWELLGLEVVFEDNQLVTALLEELPACFKVTINSSINTGDLSIERAEELVVAADQRIASGKVRGEQGGSTLISRDGAAGSATPTPGRKEVRCFDCILTWHSQRYFRAKGDHADDTPGRGEDRKMDTGRRASIPRSATTAAARSGWP